MDDPEFLICDGYSGSFIYGRYKVAWGIAISAAHLLSYNTKNPSSLRKPTVVVSITFVFETGVNWSSKVPFITLLLFQNLDQNQ